MAYDILQKAINNISITDTVAPKYKGDGTHTEHESVFLLNINDEPYAYKLISKDSYTEGKLIKYTWEVNGIHYWKYEGEQTLQSRNDATPNTNGKFFIHNGTAYNYALVSYSELDHGEVSGMAYELASGATGSSVDIKRYDYNVNGVLDQQDIEIALSHCMTDPYFILWDLNKKAVETYFNMIPQLYDSNGVVYRTTSTLPVEYAFCLPTASMDPNSYGVSYDFPVQILPKEYYNEISSEYKQDKFGSDEDQEYIAWEPTRSRWAWGSYSNPEKWDFKSGLYVFLLNDDGTNRMEWIK